jgi:trk system potassium uptake protein TrkA
VRIVIAGAGSVGHYMGEQLIASGHHVTLVDVDPDRIRRARRVHGEEVGIVGDACELGVLATAGAADADVLAAVTGDDEDNLVVSLLAKQEFGVPRVVARVNNPNNEWMFTDMWGVDVSVSTPHLLTGLVEEAVSVGTFVRLLSFEHGRAKLAEVTLAPDSPAAGRRVVDLGLPRESTVVAVLREAHVVVPRGDTVVLAGDEVVVLVTGDAEPEVRAVLIGPPALQGN